MESNTAGVPAGTHRLLRLRSERSQTPSRSMVEVLVRQIMMMNFFLSNDVIAKIGTGSSKH